MAFFCSIMLEIALTLAKRDCIYEDMASKFFEHFVAIADAINQKDGIGKTYWVQHCRFLLRFDRFPKQIISDVIWLPFFS
jgi:hypothetical protein